MPIMGISRKRGFMGAASRFVQKMQNEQNEQKGQISAICHLCGSQGAYLYVEEKEDKWTLWRPVYKTEYRRFLCVKCMKCMKPSLCHLFERGNKQAIRALPLYDDFGKLLPTTAKIQLECIPQYYPMNYLGQKNIFAEWTDVTYCKDCIVLTLVPYKGQDYYMDEHLKIFGVIYSSCPLNYWLPDIELPSKVQFQSFFDYNGRPRTKIYEKL